MTRWSVRFLPAVAAVMALAAPGLAQTTDKAAAAEGTATGQFTVNGKAAAFKTAVVEAKPDTFDDTKTGYKLVLSDVKGLPGEYGSYDEVTSGKLHYVELEIGHNKQVYGAMLYHAGFKNTQISTAGNVHFDVETFGPDILAGKVYVKPEEFAGATYEFTATFKAPIKKK